MAVFRKSMSLMLICVAFASAQPAWSDAYFDQGKSLYDKKQYKNAASYFHKSAENAPWDSTAAYYEALSYHMCGDYKNAALGYKNVMEHFPGSNAYVNAASALRVLDPNYLTNQSHNTQSQGSATTTAAGAIGSSDLKALLEKVQVSGPNESRIPVTRVTDKTLVDGTVNGRAFKFEFGGDATTLSPKDAASLNLAGKSGRVPVTMRVGQIAEYGFPLLIENTDHPKLGTEFFHKFSYRLEPSQLLVTKSGAGSYDLPFQLSGNDMKVRLSVNGRSASVILDVQGGENVCPRNRTRELGLDVEDKSVANIYSLQNPDGARRGEAGFGEVKDVSSAPGKVVLVGPITADVTFKIDDKAKDIKVGTSVFGGWQYQIDQGTKVIHFSKN